VDIDAIKKVEGLSFRLIDHRDNERMFEGKSDGGPTPD